MNREREIEEDLRDVIGGCRGYADVAVGEARRRSGAFAGLDDRVVGNEPVRQVELVEDIAQFVRVGGVGEAPLLLAGAVVVDEDLDGLARDPTATRQGDE